MLIAGVGYADPFFLSTGNPDGIIATATRPETAGKFEIESADGFLLTSHTKLTQATFVGLLTSTGVGCRGLRSSVVEIYRGFPADSDVRRTSGSPLFSTPNVPTRVNSPSDVAFDSRDSSTSRDLTFAMARLGTFTALNSVLPGGIHPQPNIFTGGNGPVTGTEVQFIVTFTTRSICRRSLLLRARKSPSMATSSCGCRRPGPLCRPGLPSLLAPRTCRVERAMGPWPLVGCA